jgi:HEAT repeat protein
MRMLLSAIALLSLIGCNTGPTPPNTEARVRHWIEALHKPDAKLRKEAAFKLGNLGLTDPASVVPALMTALKDAEASVRCEAILALVKCGPAAKEAAARLTNIQKTDEDARARDYAAKALSKINASK